MMLDFQNMSENDLSRFGIAFSDPDEAQVFSKFVQEEIEVRVGRKIAEGLPESKLREFDSISDPKEANNWLERNRPDYREIVEIQNKYLAWDLLRFSSMISTSSKRRRPLGADRSIYMLHLSEEGLNCLYTGNLQTIRKVIEFGELSCISGMNEKIEQEIITKIVDYLFEGKKHSERKYKEFLVENK